MKVPRIKLQQIKRIKINGFTLIELIVVIVLLAIIAVYASSKYMGVSRFSSAAAQEQVMSILRQIQVASMQTNIPINETNKDGVDDCRILHLASDKFGVSQACQNQNMNSAVLSDYSKETNQQQLELIKLSYEFTNSDGAISISQLSFDLLGRPIIPLSSATSSLCSGEDCRITITTSSSNESRSVCINGEGFIYRSILDEGCGL